MAQARLKLALETAADVPTPTVHWSTDNAVLGHGPNRGSRHRSRETLSRGTKNSKRKKALRKPAPRD